MGWRTNTCCCPLQMVIENLNFRLWRVTKVEVTGLGVKTRFVVLICLLLHLFENFCNKRALKNKEEELFSDLFWEFSTHKYIYCLILSFSVFLFIVQRNPSPYCTLSWGLGGKHTVVKFVWCAGRGTGARQQEPLCPHLYGSQNKRLGKFQPGLRRMSMPWSSLHLFL